MLSISEQRLNRRRGNFAAFINDLPAILRRVCAAKQLFACQPVDHVTLRDVNKCSASGDLLRQQLQLNGVCYHLAACQDGLRLLWVLPRNCILFLRRLNSWSPSWHFVCQTKINRQRSESDRAIHYQLNEHDNRISGKVCLKVVHQNACEKLIKTIAFLCHEDFFVFKWRLVATVKHISLC